MHKRPCAEELTVYVNAFRLFCKCFRLHLFANTLWRTLQARRSTFSIKPFGRIVLMSRVAVCTVRKRISPTTTGYAAKSTAKRLARIMLVDVRVKRKPPSSLSAQSLRVHTVCAWTKRRAVHTRWAYIVRGKKKPRRLCDTRVFTFGFFQNARKLRSPVSVLRPTDSNNVRRFRRRTSYFRGLHLSECGRVL